MRIIEKFSQGKWNDPNRNEDTFIITDDFVAVLDGATTKTCPEIDGRTGGRFAVDTAEKIIGRFDADITARAAVDALSNGLKEAVAQWLDFDSLTEKPAYALAIYSRQKQQVWRVADPLLLIDGRVSKNELPTDEVATNLRAFVIEAALRKGVTIEDLKKEDLGRKFIWPLFEDQYLFTNVTGAFGYGVINGQQVPDDLIQIVDISDAKELVMASDGYLDLFSTLEQTEKYLFDVLKEDPMLYKKHKSTKGLQEGQVSFDDRTYVRLALS